MYKKLPSSWIIPKCTFETYPVTWKISPKCPLIQALLSIHLPVLLKPRDHINSLWTDKQGVCFLLDLEGITLSVEELTMLFMVHLQACILLQCAIPVFLLLEGEVQWWLMWCPCDPSTNSFSVFPVLAFVVRCLLRLLLSVTAACLLMDRCSADL